MMDDAGPPAPTSDKRPSPELCIGEEKRSGGHLNQLTASRIYWGTIFTQFVVILMTLGVFFFTATLGIFQVGLITTFAFPYPADQVVANTLEIAFYLGWFVMLAPISGGDSLQGFRVTRVSIRICLVILTAAAVFGYLPIFGQLRPALDMVNGVLQLLTIIPSIVIIPLHFHYVGQLAELLTDTKLRRSARVWTWLTPVLLLVSVILVYAVHEIFFWFMLLSVLISVILYWNTLNRLRTDLKHDIHSSVQPDH